MLQFFSTINATMVPNFAQTILNPDHKRNFLLMAGITPTPTASPAHPKNLAKAHDSNQSVAACMQRAKEYDSYKSYLYVKTF